MSKVYLGKRVPDLGGKSLSNPIEAIGIANAIIADFVSGKIDARTATSRLNLLELILKKDRDINPVEEAISRGYIDLIARPTLKASEFVKKGLLGDDR